MGAGSRVHDGFDRRDGFDRDGFDRGLLVRLTPGVALAQGRAAGARDRRGDVQREHGPPEPVEHDPQFVRPARASRASVRALSLIHI